MAALIHRLAGFVLDFWRFVGDVPEYWIVNPLNDTITVLVLKRKKYAKHATFIRGQEATSVILPGFSVNVADVFDAD